MSDEIKKTTPAGPDASGSASGPAAANVAAHGNTFIAVDSSIHAGSGSVINIDKSSVKNVNKSPEPAITDSKPVTKIAKFEKTIEEFEGIGGYGGNDGAAPPPLSLER